jgi:glycosyltransferase involved in cell wall biosynthesis
MVSMNTTIATVGLCTKNSEKTVLSPIKSIIEQDFPHELMEIIVVDGCSEDQTLPIIKEHLSTTTIRTSIYSEKAGLGFARQLVVDNARGDYILWVDSDLALSKSYLRQLVAVMEAHPSVGVAIGSYGILTDDNWISTLENIGYVIDSLNNRGKETLRVIGTGGSILRVEAVRNAGGFNQEIEGAHEDMDLAYRLRKNGWKFYVADATLYHRQRKTWKDFWKQQYWYGYGLHFFQSAHKDHNLLTDKAVDRILFSSQAYKLSHRKVVFLLPIHFFVKKTVLFLGYFSAHLAGYGHSVKHGRQVPNLETC